MVDYIGQILDDKYEVIRKLGSGGFGTVYLAYDDLAKRNVTKIFN